MDTVCHALVVAAGEGTRMGVAKVSTKDATTNAAVPKQYQQILGRPLLRYSIEALLATERISCLYVVLARQDAWWNTFDWSDVDERIKVLRCGGITRAASVTSGLRAMSKAISATAWVLVHDAARCCLTPEITGKLIDAVTEDDVGGLLAAPVADTIKRSCSDNCSDNNEDKQALRVAQTVSRHNLWQAQTPQMFRLKLLLEALERFPDATDEAAAIEQLGLSPQLVVGDATNFKVTYPFDLQLAAWVLGSRQ